MSGKPPKPPGIKTNALKNLYHLRKMNFPEDQHKRIEKMITSRADKKLQNEYEKTIEKADEHVKSNTGIATNKLTSSTNSNVNAGRRTRKSKKHFKKTRKQIHRK